MATGPCRGCIRGRADGARVARGALAERGGHGVGARGAGAARLVALLALGRLALEPQAARVVALARGQSRAAVSSAAVRTASFGLAELLRQRNVAGAHQVAAAALDAVEQALRPGRAPGCAARACQSSCCGSSRAGQALAQSPQRMQGISGPAVGHVVRRPAPARSCPACRSGSRRAAATGPSSARPAAGARLPRCSRRPVPPGAPPACRWPRRNCPAAPRPARSPSPRATTAVRPAPRRASRRARWPTFCTTTPMSRGSPPRGTSRPVSTWISWRSPPSG